MGTARSATLPATSRDVSAEVTFLARAMKAPTLRDSVDRLAERARAENWTHKQFLVACLQREVSAAAMIDRLIHHAEVIALKGDSCRLKTETSAASQPPRPMNYDNRK
jgi:hypothetical protein